MRLFKKEDFKVGHWYYTEYPNSRNGNFYFQLETKKNYRHHNSIGCTFSWVSKPLVGIYTFDLNVRTFREMEDEEKANIL